MAIASGSCAAHTRRAFGLDLPAENRMGVASEILLIDCTLKDGAPVAEGGAFLACA